jgi:hypothetical protein
MTRANEPTFGYGFSVSVQRTKHSAPGFTAQAFVLELSKALAIRSLNCSKRTDCRQFTRRKKAEVIVSQMCPGRGDAEERQ